MKIILSLTIALIMIVGGAAHFVSPAYYIPLIPPFLPSYPIIIASGYLEIGIGLIALWPRTRAWGGLAFAGLCLAYLPLHLWDYVRADPVFAPPVAATVRVVMQLCFIWMGYTLWKRCSVKPA